MEKIGVVSVTYNSEKVLDAFLKDIFKQIHSNFILYVVDNASKDSTLEILSKYDDNRIKLIKNKSNIGVAAANNLGVKNAFNDNCSQILLLNNDIEFSDNLLCDLLLEQSNNKCSLVAPKIMFYNNKDTIWYAGGWFNKDKGYIPSHRGINEKDNGQYDKSLQIEYASTCCLLIKKEVFDDIGFMDEKYFVYFDDTDFLYRVLKNGKHHLWFCPQVILYHKVGSLSKSFVRNKKSKLVRGDFFLKQNTRNHIYFLRKIGTTYAYLYCLYLLLKNNLRFLFSPMIKKNVSTFFIINKSYFQGWYL